MKMQDIIQQAKQMGINKIGVIKARIFDELKEHHASFLNPRRINPFLMMENAKSIVVCLFPYQYGYTINGVSSPLSENGYPIAKYAQSEDYHIWVKQRLHSLACRAGLTNFKVYADTSPLPEKYLAYLASLTFTGKNALAINECYGSRFFIGYILTNVDLSRQKAPIQSPCGDCTRCIDACPASALSGQGLNRQKCLSHISQKQGKLTAEESAMLKESGCIWGCDICADVCPYNAGLIKSALKIPSEDFALSDEMFLHKYKNYSFVYKGMSVLRRNISVIDQHEQAINNRFPL